jgi:hypothetical protein
MITVGIDTGMAGGICFLWDNGMAMHSMPTTMINKKDKVDSYKIFDIMFNASEALGLIDMILIEDAQGGLVMGNGPVKNSPITTYSQGYNAGKVEAVIEILDYPRQLITGKVWKTKLGITLPKGSTPKQRKECAIAKADSLMPQWKHLWRGPQGGVKDGLAEAALLAYLARRL